MKSLMLAWSLIAICVAAGSGPASSIGHDEEIVFFPAFAAHDATNDLWEAEVEGWIYDPEQRRAAHAVLDQAIEHETTNLTESQRAVFKERVFFFLTNHRRRESVAIRLGNKTYPLGQTRDDGRFSGRVRFNRGELDSQYSSDILPFQAVLAQGDSRVFSGEIHLINSTGVTVVCDIDDTIKISQVTNQHLLAKNMFCEPFRPVPGMNGLYRHLAHHESAEFWYVSASPWQLFEPLSAFVRSNGYPNGIFCLRDFQGKHGSLRGFLRSAEKHQTGVIEPLMKKFPARQFVLIGNSGQRDPEIYAALAHKYPRQVESIYIREVTTEAPGSPRYRRLANHLLGTKWVVFRSPVELDGIASASY